MSGSRVARSELKGWQNAQAVLPCSADYTEVRLGSLGDP